MKRCPPGGVGSTAASPCASASAPLSGAATEPTSPCASSASVSPPTAPTAGADASPAIWLPF
eukprot:scaffold70631_cov55-Phaeocystis_antarctica.AAC.2